LTDQLGGPQGHARDADPSQSMPVGRVGRAHGLDGSFYVTRPRPRMLVLGAAITVAGTTAAIVRRAGTDARPIVRLEGISDREGAEELRGAEMTAQRSAAPALQDGEWWAHELEGCAVLDGELLLGTVTRMLELPSCEALEVEPAQGGAPVIVPMVKDAIRSIAPSEKRIEVDLDFLGLRPSQDGAGESAPA
jgi:16S rRNA processing protein RimM